MNRAPTDQLTAAELLDRVWDFLGLVGVEGWTEADIADNPPRAIRLLQIHALLRALGLEPDVRGFLTGKFLADRPVSELQPFFEEARQTLAAAHRGHAPPRFDETARPDVVLLVFTRLVRFRQSAHQLLNFNSGVLEASGLYRYPLALIDSVNATLAKELGEIERVLALLVDPELRAFDRQTLIRDFGFPDVDLAELDADWA